MLQWFAMDGWEAIVLPVINAPKHCDYDEEFNGNIDRMGASMKNWVWGRAVGILICLAIIARGIFSLYNSGGVYNNYWGGLVFAPIGILVGILFIYVIIFRWDTLKKPMIDKKGRKIRFPGDDFRKW